MSGNCFMRFKILVHVSCQKSSGPPRILLGRDHVMNISSSASLPYKIQEFDSLEKDCCFQLVCGSFALKTKYKTYVIF